MSKKPSVKNKEVNPLLKSLNIEKMNSTQIQQEITKEEKLLNNFISHYKYHEAEICDNKISALKKILKQKKAISRASIKVSSGSRRVKKKS